MKSVTFFAKQIEMVKLKELVELLPDKESESKIKVSKQVVIWCHDEPEEF